MWDSRCRTSGESILDFLIQIVTNFLHVIPGFTLFRRITKQIGRMKCWHHLDSIQILKRPAKLCYSHLRIKQISHGRISHDDNHLGFNYSDFTQQKGPASLGLCDCRLTVHRWSAAIYVSDEYFFARHADGLDDFCQELTCSSNEGSALRVLIGARRLTDEHQTGVGVPLAVDNVRALLAQGATRTVADFGSNVFEPCVEPRGGCVGDRRTFLKQRSILDGRTPAFFFHDFSYRKRVAFNRVNA